MTGARGVGRRCHGAIFHGLRFAASSRDDGGCGWATHCRDFRPDGRGAGSGAADRRAMTSWYVGAGYSHGRAILYPPRGGRPRGGFHAAAAGVPPSCRDSHRDDDGDGREPPPEFAQVARMLWAPYWAPRRDAGRSGAAEPPGSHPPPRARATAGRPRCRHRPRRRRCARDRARGDGDARRARGSCSGGGSGVGARRCRRQAHSSQAVHQPRPTGGAGNDGAARPRLRQASTREGLVPAAATAPEVLSHVTVHA